MTNKLAFEALDRTLRDLMGKGQPMGGMCMLLCGDFRRLFRVVLEVTLWTPALRSLLCGTM